MGLLGIQLKFLVKNSNDPAVALYALQYLRSDRIIDEDCKGMVDPIRKELIQHTSMLAWNPEYVRNRPIESSITSDAEQVQKTIESYTSKTSVEERFKKEQLQLFMKQQQQRHLLWL